VILKYAQRINGLTAIALTKIDVLEGLRKVKVCVAYEKDGKETRELPPHIEGYKPVYEEQEGWERSYEKGLTGEVMKYIDFIEKETKVPVSIVSYGSSREKTEMLKELV
jgi:Adenylosuccinate synthase